MNRNFKNKIITIVDVGALGGIDDRLEHINYQAVLFEPNPKVEFKQRKNWIIIGKALSDSPSERNLYVTKKESNSSFFEPNFQLLRKFTNPDRFSVVNKISVNTDTLDNQLLVNGIDDVDYIKLDAQGAELLILKGATKSLQKATIVKVEVMFTPMYLNQPLFGEVDQCLRENKFELLEFLNLETWQYGERKQLIWADALYVKDSEYITSDEKREKLKIIQNILLSNKKYIINPKKISNIKKKFKYFIKRTLVIVGLYHPSMGIKVGQETKAALLIEHKMKGTSIFVETGTYKGEMLDKIGGYFKKVYSIEVDSSLFRNAKKRFSNKEHIKILYGDSGIEINKILSEIKEPTLFWLDAHPPGRISVKEDIKTAPVREELEAIFKHENKDHVILIDDARHFDKWTISYIKKLSKANGYRTVIKKGIFRIFPENYLDEFTRKE